MSSLAPKPCGDCLSITPHCPPTYRIYRLSLSHYASPLSIGASIASSSPLSRSALACPDRDCAARTHAHPLGTALPFPRSGTPSFICQRLYSRDSERQFQASRPLLRPQHSWPCARRPSRHRRRRSLRPHLHLHFHLHLLALSRPLRHYRRRRHDGRASLRKLSSRQGQVYLPGRLDSLLAMSAPRPPVQAARCSAHGQAPRRQDHVSRQLSRHGPRLALDRLGFTLQSRPSRGDLWRIRASSAQSKSYSVRNAAGSA